MILIENKRLERTVTDCRRRDPGRIAPELAGAQKTRSSRSGPRAASRTAVRESEPVASRRANRHVVKINAGRNAPDVVENVNGWGF